MSLKSIDQINKFARMNKRLLSKLETAEAVIEQGDILAKALLEAMGENGPNKTQLLSCVEMYLKAGKKHRANILHLQQRSELDKPIDIN